MAKPNTSPPPKEMSFVDTVIDIGKGILSGPPKEAENIVQSSHDIVNAVDNSVLDGRFIKDDTDVDYVPDILKPETGLGRTAQSLTAFATGWVTAGKFINVAAKGVKGAQLLAKTYPKLAAVTTSIAKNGVVDFVTGDTTDTRLADVLIENKVLGNAVVDYLKSDPNDSAVEARFKNMLEGAMIGAPLGAIANVFGVFKGARQAMKAGEKSASVAASAETRKRVADYLAQNGLNLKSVERNVEYTAEAKKVLGIREMRETITGLFNAKKAIQKTGHDGLDVGLNYDKFKGTTKAVITTFDEELLGIHTMDHMDMTKLGEEAIDNCVKAGIGQFFSDKATLDNVLKDQTSMARVATYNTYLQVGLGPALDNALQGIKEGVPEAMEKARMIVANGYEICAGLKNMQFVAGQTVKAGDVLRYLPGKAKKAVEPKVIEDTVRFARDTIGPMKDDEILKLAQTLSTVAQNGDDVVRVFMSALHKENVLRKLSKDGEHPILDSVLKYRYLSMLSGIKTQVKNLAGDMAMMGLMSVEEPAKAMFQGAITGFKNEGLSGMALGAAKGAKNGAQYWRGLSYATDIAKEHMQLAWHYGATLTHASEVNTITKGLLDKDRESLVSTIYEVPFKALAAMDEWFSTMAGTAKTFEMAMTDLNASGILKNVTDPKMRKDITAQFIDDAMSEGFLKTVSYDGRTIERGRLGLVEAKKAADAGTFQSQLGKTMEGFIHFVNNNPHMKFLFPFVRTPANMYKEPFWTRGIGILPDIYNAYKSGDPKLQAEAVTHMITGAMLWGTAWKLVAEGKVTGSGPKSKTQRDALFATGWQPNAIHVGDSYLNLSAFEPFGAALEVLANYAEISQRSGVEEDAYGDQGEMLLNSLLTFTKDRVCFSGISSLIEDIGRGNVVGGAFSNVVKSFIPNAFADVARSMDPVIGDARNFTDKINEKLGMNAEIAPRVAWLTGSPLVYRGGGGLGPFSPYMLTKDKGQGVEMEMTKLQGVGDPERKIGNINLSPPEYADLCRLHGTVQINGKTLYQTLDALVHSEAYDIDRMRVQDEDQFTLDPRRNKALERVIREFRDEAESQFVRTHLGFKPAMGVSEETLTNLTNF